MLYVRLDESGVPCEVPVSLETLKRRFSRTIFPAKLSEDILKDIGYAFVPEAEPPVRKELHATVPDIPVLNDIGDVIRTFRYIPYTEEGLQKRMNELRNRRDELLAESDWTQSEDVQNRMTAIQKQEWAEYRASLRNMTKDFVDPNIVTYPAVPATPELVPVNTQSARNIIKRKIAAKRVDVQNAGMEYVFPDGVKGTVQTRNTVDITNIISLAVCAMAMSIDGQDKQSLAFRDQENVTHQLTPLQMVAMAMQAMTFVSSTYEKKWALERKFDASADSGMSEEALKAFDVDEGWA